MSKVWIQDEFHGGENDLLPPNAIGTADAAKLTNLVPGLDGKQLKVRGGLTTLLTLHTHDGGGLDVALGESINRLYRHSRTVSSDSGTEIDLAATPSRVLHYDVNGVCTVKHTWAHSGYDTAFTSLLNTAFACNGIDPMIAWDGNADPGVTVITDRTAAAPVCQRLIAFRGRLWGFDATGRYVHFSGTSDASDVIAGSSPVEYYKRWQIWSGTLDSDGGYYSVGDDDGQTITGIGSLYNGIVVFKERSIYIWSYPDAVHPIDVAGGANVEVLVPGVGCAAHDTICYQDGAMLFLGQNAVGDYSVYRLLGNGIDDIAVKVPKAIHRVIATGTSKPRATLFDNLYLLAADDFDESGTARTLVYAYDTKRKCWFEIDGWNIGTFGFSKERGKLLVGSATDGVVREYPSGTTDDGTPIAWLLRTRLIDGGDSFNEWKWRLAFADVTANNEVVHVAHSVNGKTYNDYIETVRDEAVDYWENEDGSGFDGSYWDDGTEWYEGNKEVRLSSVPTGRGRTLQVEVSGSSRYATAIHRVGVRMKKRKAER